MSFTMSQSIADKSKNSLHRSVVWKGVKFGFKAGLGLSIIYAVLGILVVEILGIGLDLGLLGPIVASPIIFILGIAPATVFGILTGIILGLFAANLKRYFSRLSFAVFSIAICVLLVGLFHLVFGVQIVLSFQTVPVSPSYLSAGIYETYPFYIGIPTIIYILTGGWAGWELYPKETIGEKNN